jgi:hypothetical protein
MDARSRGNGVHCANNEKETANTRGADGYQSLGTWVAYLHFVYSQRKKVHRLSSLCDAETVTVRVMNRTAPEGGQGLLLGS